ncbi:GSCOCT00001930001.2-RA-CDS, partial [Cotesia congregata]
MSTNKNDDCYIEILEQPCSKSRFRYPCEARNNGSIVGATNNSERKTWPKIKIHGFKGKAVVIVSCVTKDEPHRPHPHEIIGKEKCNLGYYHHKTYDAEVSFQNLGIQCVKKKAILAALEKRKRNKIDPFNTGFKHMKLPDIIDLTAVRLCFQVFLKDDEEKYTIPLKPVVSEPIYDKKILNDLVIIKLSHCSAPVTGGVPMILLCDKVPKDNINIVFFEQKNGQNVWEAPAKFNPSDVFRQVSISFESPAYSDLSIEEPVQVFIQLRKLTGRIDRSEPLPFTFTPVGGDSEFTLKRKRQRMHSQTSARLDLDFEESKPIVHCPKCNCFKKSPLTETRKITDKLMMIRKQTIKKSSLDVDQPLIDKTVKNDAPLDLHCKKDLANDSNKNNNNNNNKSNVKKRKNYQQHHQEQQLNQLRLNHQQFQQHQNQQQQLNQVQQQQHLQNQLQQQNQNDDQQQNQLAAQQHHLQQQQQQMLLQHLPLLQQQICSKRLQPPAELLL